MIDQLPPAQRLLACPDDAGLTLRLVELGRFVRPARGAFKAYAGNPIGRAEAGVLLTPFPSDPLQQAALEARLSVKWSNRQEEEKPAEETAAAERTAPAQP